MPDIKVNNLYVQFSDNYTDTSPNLVSGDDIKVIAAKSHKRFTMQDDEIESIKDIIDNGSKNLLSFPYDPGRTYTLWKDFNLHLSPGTYVLSFSSLTSDSSSTTCEIGGWSGTSGSGTQVLNYTQIDKGTNTSLEFTITSDLNSIRIYAGSTYALSQNKTLTILGAMICTKSNWDLSPTYTPYCPTLMDSTNVILYPTGDQTDRSAEIMYKLNTFGECRLSPGTYYVSGINMPSGSKISGCGKSSILKLMSSVVDGYCLRIHYQNTVSNIYFIGGDEAPTGIYTDGTTIGTRHGIYMEKQNNDSSTRTNIVSDCFFENFSGGGYTALNTSDGLINSVIMDNCWFFHCMVGINIPQSSEYGRFSNCSMFRCNIACINNGGNNMFTNCMFHGVKGMIIDGTKTNSAHGSCVGCTFNHMNNMNSTATLGGGIGIQISDVSAGFIFTGCQIWYSSIQISNSQGIQISDSIISGNISNSTSIVVTGNYGAYFYDCIFGEQHATINVNEFTQFYNCIEKASKKNIKPDWVTSTLINENGKNVMLKVTRVGRSNGDATSTYTYNGISYTVNSDGTITLTRTATNSNASQVWLYSPDTTQAILCDNYSDGSYVISSGISYVNVSIRVKTGSGTSDYIDLHEYATIPNTSYSGMNISIVVASDFTGSVTVKPMICKKGYYLFDQTYIEHTPTNKELYDMIQSSQANRSVNQLTTFVSGEPDIDSGDEMR